MRSAALASADSLILSTLPSATNSPRGASHALLASLGSCAQRIGLDGGSCLLRGLCESVSLDLFLLVIVGVLAYPAFELFILPKQELERLAHDVGSVRVDELGVPV